MIHCFKENKNKITLLHQTQFNSTVRSHALNTHSSLEVSQLPASC